jgi:purine nucleosidase/ribosylpyrimidine nucleosidase
MAARKLILDVDTGTDDAVAVMFAALHPDLDLLAVTTVNGNLPVENTTDNTLRVLDWIGRPDIAVHPGLSRAIARPGWLDAIHAMRDSPGDGHGRVLPIPATELAAHHVGAVEYLVETFQSTTEQLTLVAVGPLSNVATALAVAPRIIDAIDELVVMGGSHGIGNVTASAEFNIWADPEAAATVFRSGADVTMIGLDVTHKALMTPAHGQRLREAGRTGTFVAELLEFYSRFHREVYSFPGSPIHDAVAVAHVLDPKLVETKHRNVEIELESELCRGRTVVDLWCRTEREPNAYVAVDIDSERFLELLLSRLATFP